MSVPKKQDALMAAIAADDIDRCRELLGSGEATVHGVGESGESPVSGTRDLG